MIKIENIIHEVELVEISSQGDETKSNRSYEHSFVEFNSSW